MGLFQAPPGENVEEAGRLREKIAAIDVDRLTPMDALTLLAELKKEL